jgi:hypothetical protein
MERLMELVAASFVRHGVECPSVDSNQMWGRTASTVPASLQSEAPTDAPEPRFATSGNSQAAAQPEAAALSAVFPAHNFGKSSQGDPAP